MSSTQNLQPSRRGQTPPRHTQSASAAPCPFIEPGPPGVMQPFLLVWAARERGSWRPFSGRPAASTAPEPGSMQVRVRTPTEPWRATNARASAAGRAYGGTTSPPGKSSTEMLYAASSCAQRSGFSLAGAAARQHRQAKRAIKGFEHECGCYLEHDSGGAVAARPAGGGRAEVVQADACDGRAQRVFCRAAALRHRLQPREPAQHDGQPPPPVRQARARAWPSSARWLGRQRGRAEQDRQPRRGGHRN
jgi:hypothetical protein